MNGIAICQFSKIKIFNTNNVWLHYWNFFQKNESRDDFYIKLTTDWETSIETSNWIFFYLDHLSDMNYA